MKKEATLQGIMPVCYAVVEALVEGSVTAIKNRDADRLAEDSDFLTRLRGKMQMETEEGDE